MFLRGQYKFSRRFTSAPSLLRCNPSIGIFENLIKSLINILSKKMFSMWLDEFIHLKETP